MAYWNGMPDDNGIGPSNGLMTHQELVDCGLQKKAGMIGPSLPHQLQLQAWINSQHFLSAVDTPAIWARHDVANRNIELAETVAHRAGLLDACGREAPLPATILKICERESGIGHP